MDSTPRPTLQLGFILPLLSTVALLLLLIRRNRNKSKPAGQLPPGPLPWPLLGNLPHLLRLLVREPQPLHAAFASLSRYHGRHLLYLRLGTQPFVVASSPEAASQVLRTHDRVLSDRGVPASYRIPMYTEHSLVWSSPQRNGSWKAIRSLCRAEIFSSGSLEARASMRAGKVAAMVEMLRGKEGREVEIAKVVFDTVFDMFARTVFSRDLIGERGGPLERRGMDLKKDFKRGLELGTVPNLEDFFPGLVGGWDLQHLRKETTAITRRQYEVWEELILLRRGVENGRGAAEEGRDFLDIMLSAGIDNTQIKPLLSDLFPAATDTTTTTIEWLMSELIKNPESMKRLKEELDAEEDSIEESRLIHLPYLQACIKETLRLHPPTPTLLPHYASEACEVMGYLVPKDSVVLVNAWAIGKDPEVWEEPLVFSPERFLGSNSRDFKGSDFEFIPFGSGRRACPGMSLGVRVISLAISSMLRNFDWSLPNGMLEDELSMEEKISLIACRKFPLVVIPTCRGIRKPTVL